MFFNPLKSDFILEVCQNAVFGKIDIIMTTINKKL